MARIRLSASASEKFVEGHGRICCLCGGRIGATEAWDRHHVIELAAGGTDTPDNWRPAHRKCHRDYTAKVSAPRTAKTRRQKQKNLGYRKTATMPGSRNSRFKKKLNGEVVLR